jgi:hypothetical protein
VNELHAAARASGLNFTSNLRWAFVRESHELAYLRDFNFPLIFSTAAVFADKGDNSIAWSMERRAVLRL